MRTSPSCIAHKWFDSVAIFEEVEMSSRLVLVLGDLFIPDRASVSEQIEARPCVC
jgi:hypothetical protein